MKDNQKWYWDWIKHEGNVFNARVNFFLVAESMLLVGVVALITSSTNHADLLLLICLAGLLVTVVWLCVNGKHRKTQAVIVKKLERLYQPYKKIKKESRKFPWCIANHTMMGFILPLGILILWLFLLIQLEPHPLVVGCLIALRKLWG